MQGDVIRTCSPRPANVVSATRNKSPVQNNYRLERSEFTPITVISLTDRANPSRLVDFKRGADRSAWPLTCFDQMGLQCSPSKVGNKMKRAIAVIVFIFLCAPLLKADAVRSAI